MLTAVRLFYLAHFQDCPIGRMCVCPLALANLQNIVSFTIYRPFNISCLIRRPLLWSGARISTTLCTYTFNSFTVNIFVIFLLDHCLRGITGLVRVAGGSLERLRLFRFRFLALVLGPPVLEPDFHLKLKDHLLIIEYYRGLSISVS